MLYEIFPNSRYWQDTCSRNSVKFWANFRAYHKFSYLCDYLNLSKQTPNIKLWNSLNGTHIHGAIIEVSLPNSYKEKALKTGHLTPELLKYQLDIMVNLPDIIYVTHTKPTYQKRVNAELKKQHIKNVKILKDGETHEI